MTYAVITDSAATLSAETALRWGIGVVPLGLTIDGIGTSDTEVDVAGFYRALARGAVLTSSQPAPGALAAAYRRAAQAGAEGVWSLHLGSALSSTVEVARLVAAAAPIPVKVVDTGTASMAEGLCVLAAAGALRRDRDTDVDAVVAAEAAAQANVFVSLAPDRIVAGGRGMAVAESFDVLSLAAGGRVQVAGHAESREQAVAMMASMLEGLDGRLVAVGDGGLAELGDALLRCCRGLAPGRTYLRYSVAPSIAVHTGPTVGYVVSSLHPADL